MQPSGRPSASQKLSQLVAQKRHLVKKQQQKNIHRTSKPGGQGVCLCLACLVALHIFDSRTGVASLLVEYWRRLLRESPTAVHASSYHSVHHHRGRVRLEQGGGRTFNAQKTVLGQSQPHGRPALKHKQMHKKRRHSVDILVHPFWSLFSFFVASLRIHKRDQGLGWQS